MAGHDKDFVWPYYFAKRPLDAKRIKIRTGDQFSPQDKQYIRGLGAAYGVKDADTRAFAKLNYVEVIDVHSDEMARAVYERGLNLENTRKLLKQGRA